jgi:hypothetical protein
MSGRHQRKASTPPNVRRIRLRAQLIHSAAALEEIADVVDHVGFEICERLAADIRIETMKIRAAMTAAD